MNFYQPLKTFKGLMLACVFLPLFICLPITLRINNSITSPRQEQKTKFGIGATGDFFGAHELDAVIKMPFGEYPGGNRIRAAGGP